MRKAAACILLGFCLLFLSPCFFAHASAYLPITTPKATFSPRPTRLFNSSFTPRPTSVSTSIPTRKPFVTVQPTVHPTAQPVAAASRSGASRNPWVYVSVALFGYFLFSLSRIRKSYTLQRDIEALKKDNREHLNRIDALTKTLEETRRNCFQFQSDILRLEAEKKRLASVHISPDEYRRLKDERDGLQIRINILDRVFSSFRRVETWGALLDRPKSKKYNLTYEDYESINYPLFRPHRVFYAPYAGERFHAVSWCYGLDDASVIRQCDYKKATDELHLTPCSLCVDLTQLPKEMKK